MKAKNIDLTNGSIVKGFCMFAFPLFLGSLFQQLYGTADVLFVGNILGKSEAAAVGASSILVTCLIGLFVGVSVGAGVIVARHVGSGQREKTIATIQNAIVLGFVGGIILTVVGLLLSKQALIWLQTPESILEEATIYIRIYFLAIPSMILYNMGAGILRAKGNSKVPFFVLAAGGILNVFADWFILAVLRLGVGGAAFATFLSQTATAIAVIAYLIREEKLYKVKWNIDKNVMIKICQVGFPLGIQSMIVTLSNLVVQYYINGFGETAVTAFTVYFKLENFIYMPISAFGSTMVTFISQNLGAGKEKRMGRGLVVGNTIAISVTLLICTMILSFGSTAIGLFCQDEEVIKEGLNIIWISYPFYFIYAIMEMVGGVIRGHGKSLQSMMIIVFNMCIVRIALLSYLVKAHATIRSVAAVYPISWGTAMLCFVLYYYYMKRKRSGSILLQKENTFLEKE